MPRDLPNEHFGIHALQRERERELRREGGKSHGITHVQPRKLIMRLGMVGDMLTAAQAAGACSRNLHGLIQVDKPPISTPINEIAKLPNGPIHVGRLWGQPHPPGANFVPTAHSDSCTRASHWLPRALTGSLASQ